MSSQPPPEPYQAVSYSAHWAVTRGTTISALHDQATRRKKAGKILSVLGDFRGELRGLRCLDVGCSWGAISATLAEHFGEVVGLDPDPVAIARARREHQHPNLRFLEASIGESDLPRASFDVVICNHVYEHVADQAALVTEIHRALRPDGCCYFSAGNRLMLVEGHYKLPFLSWLPPEAAHLYVRVMRKGQHYHERHLSYWALRRLLAQFQIHDYTLPIIRDPQRYQATELLRAGSVVTRLPLWAYRAIYVLLPTYVWVLTPR